MRRNFFFSCLMSLPVLVSCSVSSVFTGHSDSALISADGTLGHWEVQKRFDYGSIPDAAQLGAMQVIDYGFLVTTAGFVNDTFGITAGPDDDVRYTTDGGGTWTKTRSALHCRAGLEIVDEKTAWNCGNGGTRVSTDGGRSWKTVAPSPCASLSFLDGRTGWAANAIVLAATDDGGATWTRLYPPLGDNEIVAIALRTTRDGYILDNAGDLFVTADGGLTWEARFFATADGGRMINPVSGPRAAMRFLDKEHGIVVYDLTDRSVWFAVTADGGLSWTTAEIMGLKNQSYYYHLFLSPDGHWLTATDDFATGKNYSIVLHYVPPIA
jgi:photosystem II stability/assembly factor-like uncharacterized protein